MSESRRIRSLGRLIDLRDRDLERYSADLAARQVVRQRYIENLERLERLCKGDPSGAPAGKHGSADDAKGAPAFSPALSLNSAGYKQAIMKMADAHRVDLSLHEAEMALVRGRLIETTRRREALDTVREREREGVRQFRHKAEVKRQDEVAVQMWARSWR